MEEISSKRPYDNNGVEVYRFSKAVFGIQDAPTGGGYGGEEFGLSIMNVLWPQSEFIHRNEYTIGPTVSAKFSVEMKIDFGSEVEWGISGLHIDTTIGWEYQANNQEFLLNLFMYRGWFAALYGANALMEGIGTRFFSGDFVKNYRGVAIGLATAKFQTVFVKLGAHAFIKAN
jgi:hypothetical protein